MLCPMKFSVGCSSESKDCEGTRCMWFVRTRSELDDGTYLGTCAVANLGSVQSALYEPVELGVRFMGCDS